MSHMRKGQLAKAAVWAKHLRPDWRRLFWKRERNAEKQLERSERRIELAESSRIELVNDEAMEMIQLAFGVDRILVTDESRLADFAPSKKDMERMAQLLGHPVTRHDFVVDLAEEYAARSLGG